MVVGGNERSLLSNVAQGGAAPAWARNRLSATILRADSTRAMHGHAMAAASVWPTKVDLSSHSTLLDIGGGSGAHSIGATLKWKHLKATVYDIPAVCDAAAEYVSQYGLNQRVAVQRGDMWTEVLFPPPTYTSTARFIMTGRPRSVAN